MAKIERDNNTEVECSDIMSQSLRDRMLPQKRSPFSSFFADTPGISELSLVYWVLANGMA
jgi:hypothetical protein